MRHTVGQPETEGAHEIKRLREELDAVRRQLQAAQREAEGGERRWGRIPTTSTR